MICTGKLYACTLISQLVWKLLISLACYRKPWMRAILKCAISSRMMSVQNRELHIKEGNDYYAAILTHMFKKKRDATLFQQR